MDLEQFRNRYFNELTRSVIPFWEEFSLDREYGGYFTCLDRQGQVYDTDKFVWLQARQIWMFSKLYLTFEKKGQWLEIASHGVAFLENKGHKNGDYYFSLSRDGTPLIEPYNIFSDCFACMAYAGYGQASGQQQYADKASSVFARILQRADNPKGKWEKSTRNRPLQSFALPMILCNLASELEGTIDQALLDRTVQKSVQLVMEVFRNPKSNLISEYRGQNGEEVDCFEGRLLNPGHGIEAMWFILEIAEKSNDKGLVELAANSILATLEYAWDKEFGGVYYFMDIKGKPLQQLEWDQKLWWVHLETLIALLKAYRMTGRSELWNWFLKVDEYTWSHFPDHEAGEWFGYLNRRGEVLLSLKGGKWKGCFHVPRGLLTCWQELQKITEADEREARH